MAVMLKLSEYGTYSDSDLKSFGIQCKLAPDVPGKPGTPECAATTDDSITLSWDPPTRDGGKPIKGYVLEKREAGSKRWTKYEPSHNLQCFLSVGGIFITIVYYRVVLLTTDN